MQRFLIPRRRPRHPSIRLASVLLVGVLLLAACGFHNGGDTIAYLRDGQLWTINPDGTSATALASGGVVGFAWSPDHHLLVYRTSAGAFPSSSQAAAPDAPGELNVTSADGGGTVTITPGSSGLARSNAWWDASGNRLIYREGLPGGAIPIYVLSQSDQPAGIARIFLQDAGGIPAVAPDGSRVAWVDAAGGLHLGKPGTGGQVIASGALLALPGARPARLLWQPHQQALLYDAQNGDGQVKLVLVSGSGQGRTVGTVAGLLDDAFSPDGSLLLVRTATTFAVWRLGVLPATTVYSWDESDLNALAWWSPDGRFILVRDQAGLWLTDLRAGTTRQLLASSPWSPDSARIVFSDRGSGLWLGRSLPAPTSGGGLYVAAISGNATPQRIASGAIAWPGWSTLEPNASLLVSA